MLHVGAISELQQNEALPVRVRVTKQLCDTRKILMRDLAYIRKSAVPGRVATNSGTGGGGLLTTEPIGWDSTRPRLRLLLLLHRLTALLCRLSSHFLPHLHHPLPAPILRSAIL